MTFVLAHKLGKLALLMTTTVLVNSMVRPNVQAQEVDLNTLCREFPLNSRCQEYKSPSQPQGAAAPQAPQVMKLRLDTSASREWILIKESGNTVQMMHTTSKITGFSQLAHLAVGFSPVPVPLPNFYGWRDHQTTRVVFEPDSCSGNLAPAPGQLSGSAPEQPSAWATKQLSGSPNCTIAGTDSVTLPAGMDMRHGRFTIDYKERQLLRSITFRIPPQKQKH